VPFVQYTQSFIGYIPHIYVVLAKQIEGDSSNSLILLNIPSSFADGTAIAFNINAGWWQIGRQNHIRR